MAPSTPSAVAETRSRQACLDAAAALGLVDDDALRMRILSYLAFVVGTQVSAPNMYLVCDLDPSFHSSIKFDVLYQTVSYLHTFFFFNLEVSCSRHSSPTAVAV